MSAVSCAEWQTVLRTRRLRQAFPHTHPTAEEAERSELESEMKQMKTHSLYVHCNGESDLLLFPFLSPSPPLPPPAPAQLAQQPEDLPEGTYRCEFCGHVENKEKFLPPSRRFCSLTCCKRSATDESCREHLHSYRACLSPAQL